MTLSSWLPWALLSALFAALTAIFAKVGIEITDSVYVVLNMGIMTRMGIKALEMLDLTGTSIGDAGLTQQLLRRRQGVRLLEERRA